MKISITAAEHDDVDARQAMLDWVNDLATYCRVQWEDFIVIAQNAAELVEDQAYLQVIDAISQEQTWFDGAADNDPPGDCPLQSREVDVESQNYLKSLSPPCLALYEKYPDSTLHVSSEWYLQYLTLAHRQGKIIFTVDYVVEPQNIVRVYQTARALGFIPFVSERALSV